jgi:prepilin-type N-terminal cleavage/methylation domain-containing protein
MKRYIPHKHCPAKTNDGFTLIEVMFALFIFTVGVLGVTAMTVQSNLSYSASRQSTREVNRTTMGVEDLKYAGYSNDNVLQDEAEKGGVPFYAPGSSNHVAYQVQDNAVVTGTKLIVVQNKQVSRNAAASAYTIYYTKPEIR